MMLRKSFRYLIGPVLLSALLFTVAGCSSNEEQQVEEKGAIEKMTDRAAEKAVEKIRTPQDKARAAQSLGDDRLEQMDQALEKQ